jgi:hypothetical protein
MRRQFMTQSQLGPSPPHLQILCVAVQDIHVHGAGVHMGRAQHECPSRVLSIGVSGPLLDVNVLEQVLPHEAVITLWVLARDADVLVHVEGDNVSKRKLARLQGPRLPEFNTRPGPPLEGGKRRTLCSSTIFL